MRTLGALVGCLLAIGCAADSGCRGGAEEPAAEEPAKAAEGRSPAVSFSGRVSGVVVLAEGARVPSRPGDPRQAKLVVTDPVPPCSPLSERDKQPVELVDAGKRALSNIHLAITGMSAEPERPPRELEVVLEDCRVRPRMLGLRKGDSVRLHNRSEVALLPTFSFETVMPALAKGQQRVVKIEQPGVFTLGCGFGAYCGRADVIVLHHGLFAVSDGTGRFQIEGVPLDQELVLHAWHPLFKESRQSFRLSPQQNSREFKLVMTPAPPRQPRKTTPPEDGPSKTPDGVIIQ